MTPKKSTNTDKQWANYTIDLKSISKKTSNIGKE